jgi:hypothetical protein
LYYALATSAILALGLLLLRTEAAEWLMQTADAALYQAKEGGRESGESRMTWERPTARMWLRSSERDASADR